MVRVGLYGDLVKKTEKPKPTVEETTPKVEKTVSVEKRTYNRKK